MARYIFPAVFRQELDDCYAIDFPDLECCYTQGDNLQDAYDMAEDILCLTLYNLEETEKTIPTPSNPKNIPVGNDGFVVLIAADTLDYRMHYDNKAVKKTVTLPRWLNTMAERKGVNFSYELQTALKDKFGIQDT